MTTTWELQEDLNRKWKPTSVQIAQANTLLRAGFEDFGEGRHGVYTGHLMVNKHYGIWTTDVALVDVDGVFTNREAVSRFLVGEAARLRKTSSLPISAGYTWHPRVDEWAVFEDIMAAKVGGALD